MPDFIVGGKPVALRPSDVIGGGGEADIYRKGSTAYKIYKTPKHPDYARMPDAQKAATARLREQQFKLPVFPANLPARVIRPQELVRNSRNEIAGYTMPFLKDAEVLLRYGQRQFRDQGVSDELMVQILADLHKTVDAVHRAQVVIGDFNDLNVMVKGREAFLIDADSMQFGRFLTTSFTAQFVDPLNCDAAQKLPVLASPHTANTDWYAYLYMLMQSLLFVGPYGGVYRPQDPKLQIPHDARSLKRITVFHPDVRYPKPARHFSVLPDTLLHLLEQTFVKDARGVPQLSLIEGLRFTTCKKCGTTHARGICPGCVNVTPAIVKEVHTGSVEAKKLFSADGTVLYATVERGTLRYLYHENGVYKREGGREVLSEPLDPKLRFRISGDKTVIAKENQCYILSPGTQPESISVDSYGGLLPLIDANRDHVFFAQAGALMRTSSYGASYHERVGNVLPNQTLFWAGDTLGFGFYRAAELSNFFVFRPGYSGINDSVELPAIRGQLVDSTCVFSAERIWFFTSTREAGTAKNRCFLLDKQGVLLGSAEASPGDGSWLGTIRGKTAAGEFLLAPTDDGVVRVAPQDGTIDVVKEYPDTKRFVDTGSSLFLLKEGLVVVGRHELWHLIIR